MPELFHSNINITQDNQVYLPRPQIDALLERAVLNPVVSVTAGAGYGKTHSVYSFLQKSRYDTLWIQLSERDNVEDRFWENFTAAVAMVDRETAAKLRRGGFPVTEQRFERYSLIFKTQIKTGNRYVFVYDDIHLVQERTVLRFLERSLVIMPVNFCTIFISRTELLLNLVRYLSKGLLVKLTEEDLRFSQEEMIEYFNMQDIHPSPQTSLLIYRNTEGWAFAIHLAGLFLKNAPSGTGYFPSAIRSNMFKLIESEVMAGLSPELAKLLIKLSLIEYLNLELVREIAEAAPGNSGSALLGELERMSSFVLYESYLHAYRIHHLFLDYLRSRQAELTEEEIREVYTKAARWSADNNQKTDAMSYYEKAGDYNALIDLIYTLPQAIPDKTVRFILEIFDRAPASVYRENPVAHLIHTRCLILLMRYGEAEQEVRKLIDFYEKKGESSGFSRNESRALFGCYNNLGFISELNAYKTGNYDFTPYFEKGAYYQSQWGGEISAPMSISNVGTYINMVGMNDPGELERFIAALDASVPFKAASMAGCFWGTDDLARCEAAFFRANIEEAEQWGLTALGKARQKHQYEVENRSLFYLLRLRLFRGDAAGVKDTIKQLEAQLEIPGYINRHIYHDITMSWYYAQTGQHEKISAWLKSDYEESELSSQTRGIEILVRIKCAAAERKFAVALASVENQENGESLGRLLLGRLELKILESLCRYQMRDKTGSLTAFEEAYSLAEPNGLWMAFIEQGKNMRAMVTGFLTEKTSIPAARLEQIRRDASAYMRKLSVITRQYEVRNASRARAGLLSPREANILTGLSQGLTGEEIAEAEELSINTVKSVMKSIYNKLGAINRADAIRIATEMGILTVK
ncbi:MAG: LuxR C-terminal-related transcriptional regulator [Treponema sp.]|jgi:LuxR family maltose regulon positive regulatory protein|nr:LuxR C-terminal-related transcriptional regulator [Treponema sp.]